MKKYLQIGVISLLVMILIGLIGYSVYFSYNKLTSFSNEYIDVRDSQQEKESNNTNQKDESTNEDSQYEDTQPDTTDMVITE